MDEAAVQSSMSEIDLTDSSSTSTAVPRNVDPLAVALRSGTPLSIDEIVQLNQQGPTAVAASSSGTKPTTIFTSPEQQSAGTQPTSDGTGYNVDDRCGRGNAVAIYAHSSSASATQGSGSDTEREVIRDTNLFEIGGQFEEGHKLKTPSKCRSKRPQIRKRPKPLKKPQVVLHQRVARPLVGLDEHVDDGGAVSSSDEETGDEEAPAAEPANSQVGREKRYFRYRQPYRCSKIEVVSTEPTPADIEEGLADEVLASTATTSYPKAKPIKGARLWLLIATIVTILFTLIFSIVGAHFTGKHRLRCTKGLIYMATILISTLTVIAMVLARRAVLEALVAGLLELVTGFVLVFQVHEFMGPIAVAGVS